MSNIPSTSSNSAPVSLQESEVLIRPHTQAMAPVITNTTNLPSMAIQMDAALHKSLLVTKTGKFKLLNGMARHLFGKCFICWAWKNRIEEKPSNHHFFVHCRESGEFLDGAMDWMNLKKMLKFKKYEYCFNCGLPQEEHLLTCHPIFKKGQRLVCPLEDFVAVLCMFIFRDKKLMKEAQKSFPDLKSNMSLQDFAMWANREIRADCFYNGLELVIWYWCFRQFK